MAAPLALAGMVVPLIARLGRRILGGWIAEDAEEIDLEVENWQLYEINWGTERVEFRVDNQLVFETHISPMLPLGLVIWVDNQYASLPPDGRLRFGTLANSEQWLDICNLKAEVLSL